MPFMPYAVRSHLGRSVMTHASTGTLSSFAPQDKQPISVAVHPPDAWPDDTPTPSFSAPAFHRNLSTAVLGHTLLTAAQLHSTQTLLQDNRSVLPDGVLCVADVQTTGKGRGGNVWTSPPGCLMFSLTKQLDVGGARLPFVQYVACMAVIEAVQQLVQEDHQGDLLLRVKWPNDLYSEDGLKVGGILCHSAYKGGRFSATVGVGLNVTNDQPTTCVQSLLQRRLGSGVGVSREALLARIVNAMEGHLHTLERDGFDPLQQAYLRYWLHTGQRVEVEGAEHVTIRGLSPGGFLLAEDPQGGGVELHPDGNSLDFFKGLIRKKLPT